MARLRPQSAVAALGQYQRWRSYFAELRDPTLAAHVENYLHAQNDVSSYIIRPLKLLWAMHYPAHRMTRAFVMAASLGLCRAFWLTTCPQCLVRSAHNSLLLPMAYCFGCQRQVTRTRSLPAEMVFAGRKAGLQEGIVNALKDSMPPERLICQHVKIAPRGFGILRPHAQSEQLDLNLDVKSIPFHRSIAIQLDGVSPEKVVICPMGWESAGLALKTGGALVVRNFHSSELLKASLVPLPDPDRIAEDDVLGLPEYLTLFS